MKPRWDYFLTVCMWRSRSAVNSQAEFILFNPPSLTAGTKTPVAPGQVHRYGMSVTLISIGGAS